MHFWTSPSNLSASLMELFTSSKQNSQYWDYRAQVLDYQDFQIIGQWINTLWTGEADLRIYITTVRDG